MSEYWRRRYVEAALRRGELLGRIDGAHFRELSPGRIVNSAVFRLESTPGSLPRVGSRIDLYVQVRQDVSLLSHYQSERGGWEIVIQDDQIAIAGWGGRPDHRYTWVQIVSARPERVWDADGSVRTEDILFDNELPNVPASLFSWREQFWYVDAGNEMSARYAERGTDLRIGQNGEVIYDSPTAELTILSYMESNPTVVQVEKTTQFISFLIEIPVLRGEADRLPRRPAVAAVGWNRDQTFGRDTSGGPPRVVSQGYRVHYIVPNASLPAGLMSVMWRVFLGR